MKLTNTKTKAKKSISKGKTSEILKKTKASSKTINARANKGSDAPVSKRPPSKKASKKTIQLNPLARAGKSWNSVAPAQIMAENLSVQKPQPTPNTTRMNIDKARKSEPKKLIKKGPPNQLAAVKADFDYGSIDYFVSKGWQRVKIINKNMVLGIIDQGNHFYPLHSFRVKKAVKIEKNVATFGFLGGFVGGLVSALSAVFPSITQPSIFGYLYSHESDTEIFVKFSKCGVKSMEMARFDVK